MSRWQRFQREQSAKYQPSTHYLIGVDHITATRPPCSECSAPACVWQRCRCRVYFARCEKHQPRAVAEMRRAHEAGGSCRAA
jgi:hypothetical protein